MSQIIASTRLSVSGLTAEIRADEFVQGSYRLEVAGTPQSHVVPDNPRHLHFEYVQRIGNLIDILTPGEGQFTALHLGSGAFTIPRYIAATRPKARQQVIELEPDLVQLVREHLPLPRAAAIRVRYGDARQTLSKLPAAIVGNIDLIVVDVFSGAHSPPHLTTVEFFSELKTLLSPTGIVCINATDGPGLRFVRALASTVRSVFDDTILTTNTQVIKGKIFGNVVICTGNDLRSHTTIPRLVSRGPHPATAIANRELTQFIAGATLSTDACPVRPSTPDKRVF